MPSSQDTTEPRHRKRRRGHRLMALGIALSAGLMVASVSPAVGVTAAHAATAHPSRGLIPRDPPPPSSGRIYGPFGSDPSDNSECEYQKSLAGIPADQEGTCFYWDGPNPGWYLWIRPKTIDQTWLNTNSNMALEVYHSATNSGARVDQWPYNGSGTQWWTTLDEGSGHVRLINSNSDLCLGVSGGSFNQNAAVVQWACNGHLDQEWHFLWTGRYTGSGWPTYNIVNYNSGMCLDVPHSSTTRGTFLWQYPCNGTSAQEWY
jgi:hypothetical protein